MLPSKKIAAILTAELLFSLCMNSDAQCGPIFDQHFKAASELYKQKEFRKAVKELDIAIKEEPNNFEGYYKRAKCFSETDSPQESFPDFTRALKLNPNFADIWVSRALAYQRLNDPSHAMADLKHALSVNPKHSKAFHKLLVLCLRQKDSKTGIKYATIAIKNSVERVDMLQRRGTFYALAGDADNMQVDFNLALADVQTSLSTLEQTKSSSEKERAKLKSNLADVYNERGKAFAALKDFDRALNDFQKALSIVPNSATYMCNVGAAYLHKQQNQQALETLREACKLRADSASIHNNLGIALERTGKHTEAKLEFERALNIDSSHTQYFSNHARMALALGDAEDAMGDFVGITSMRAKGAVNTPTHVYPVVQQLNELIRLNPSDPANYYNRGIINFSQSRFENAKEDFSKFLILQRGIGESPTYGSILLSITLQNLHQTREAEQTISQAKLVANTSWSKRLLALYCEDEKVDDYMDAQASHRREVAVNCFIGLKKLAEGNNVTAEEKLKWTRDHAIPSQDEYLLAISGLNKILGKKQNAIMNQTEKRPINEAVSDAEISFK